MEQADKLSFNKDSGEEKPVEVKKKDFASGSKQTNSEEVEKKENKREDIITLTNEVTRLVNVFQGKTKIFNEHCFRMAPLDKKETVNNLKLFQNSMYALLNEFEGKLKSMQQHILALEAKKNVEAKEEIIQRSQMSTTYYDEIISAENDEIKKSREKFPPAIQPISERKVVIQDNKKNKITQNHFNTAEMLMELTLMGHDASQLEKLEKSEIESIFQALAGVQLNEPTRETQVVINPLKRNETKVTSTSQTCKTHTDKSEAKEVSFKEFIFETNKPNEDSTKYVTAKELDEELEIKEETDLQGEDGLNEQTSAKP